MACFDSAHNLRSGIAAGVWRNQRVETMQHDNHERSSIEAAAQATENERTGILPTAPCRQRRGDSTATMPSFCYALCASIALYPPWRPKYFSYDPAIYKQSKRATITLPQRSWLLNYAHDNCRSGSVVETPWETFHSDLKRGRSETTPRRGY